MNMHKERYILFNTKTNSLGRTTFSNLTQGIYLIAQEGYVESGKSQFESALF